MKRRHGRMRHAIDGERDEDGRILIRMGGACPVCEAGPDVKYSGDGNVVLVHTPAACATHLRNWRARWQAERDRTA